MQREYVLFSNPKRVQYLPLVLARERTTQRRRRRSRRLSLTPFSRILLLALRARIKRPRPAIRELVAGNLFGGLSQSVPRSTRVPSIPGGGGRTRLEGKKESSRRTPR